MRIPGLRSRQSPVYWTGVFNCFRPVLKRTKPDSNVSLLPPGGASSVPLPFYSSKVPAGFPSPAEDHLGDTLDLSTLLIKHPAATFFVRVSRSEERRGGKECGSRGDAARRRRVGT